MSEERSSVRKPAVAERRTVAPRTPAVTVAVRPIPVARSLQQRLGNQGTQTFAAQVVAKSSAPVDTTTSGTATGLSLSQPGDAQEREAESVADIVMRMPAKGVQESAAISSAALTPKVQRLCANCEDELVKKTGAPVQRKEQAVDTSLMTPTVAANIHALRDGGSALPAATRAFFEPRFGADFSQVRVHTDMQAARAASSINAKAFTVGRDIAFGDAEYQPGSANGQRLLAHELTHVVQQGAATPARSDAAPNAAAISRTDTQQVQRDFLDDAQTFAGGALDALGSAVDDVGTGISNGVSAINSGVSNAATSLAGAASAAAGIVDWIKTEAGKLALRAANALAAKFGGSVVISPEGGIDILIGDINIAELEEETHILPLGLPVDTLLDAPFEVGTFVINTSVGTVIGDPALTTAVGPVRLQDIKLHLDPFKDVYSGTGQLFVGAEVVGTGEKALEGRVQAAGVLPFEIPIPIEGSAAVGIRDIVRVAGKGNLRDTVDLRYSAGKFTVGRLTQLKLGALAQLDHEAFLRIEVEGTEICSLIWPLSSHMLGSAGVQIDMPFQLTADGEDIRAVTGEVSAEPVSVDAIETSLKNERPADHCLNLEEFAKFLCEKGKLPPDVCAIVAPSKPGSLNSPLGPIPFGPPNSGSGSNAATGPCPDPAPQPAILGIPPLRNRNIDAYQARIRKAPGPLQHRVGRERSGSFHVSLWLALMPGRIPDDVRQRGLALGLSEADLIQPYWSKTRVFKKRMEVDHIVELQVATIGQEGRFDVMSNYQLMEATQNRSAGSAMKQRIINIRNQLAKFGGDLWDRCDLTFDDVVSLGAETPQAWTQQELIAGEHIEAFERLGRPPRLF